MMLPMIGWPLGPGGNGAFRLYRVIMALARKTARNASKMSRMLSTLDMMVGCWWGSLSGLSIESESGTIRRAISIHYIYISETHVLETRPMYRCRAEAQSSCHCKVLYMS